MINISATIAVSLLKLQAHHLLTVKMNSYRIPTRIDPNHMEITVNRRIVFLIRAIMGVAFGIFLSKFFYPKAPILFIIGLCSALVVLAYVTEYLRQRSKHKSLGGPS